MDGLRLIFLRLRERLEKSIYNASDTFNVPESTLRGYEQKNSHGNIEYLAKARKAAQVTWENLGKEIDKIVFSKDRNNEK